MGFPPWLFAPFSRGVSAAALVDHRPGDSAARIQKTSPRAHRAGLCPVELHKGALTQLSCGGCPRCMLNSCFVLCGQDLYAILARLVVVPFRLLVTGISWPWLILW